MSLSDQVPEFSALRAAVVGDLIVDRYLYGQPSRLSREAPVMILKHVGEEYGAGGAANVARNVWALGARARLIGPVGMDDAGERLTEALDESDIRTDELLRAEGWTTPDKTRVLGAEPRRTMQQILRIDREPEGSLDEDTALALCDRLRSALDELDVLVVSDYGYGAVTPQLAEAARDAAARGVVVVLDPRSSLSFFSGITAATPNLAELARSTGHVPEDFDDPAVLTDAAQRLLVDRELGWLLVTMGNAGMALFGRELPTEGYWVEASGADEVIDVSGAGDTAAAAFGLALAAGAGGVDAMRMANAAAGIVVMESGTAVCGGSRLRRELPKSPVPAPRL